MAFNRSSGQQTLRATRARQGRMGRPVLWVLLVSTLLAAIGLLAAWTFKAGDFSRANTDNGGMKASGAMFNAPQPAAVTPTPAQSNNAPTTAGAEK